MTKKYFIIIPATLIFLVGALYAFANYRVKSAVDLRIAQLIENGDYLELEYNAVGYELNGDIAMHSLHVVNIDNSEYILDDIRLTDFDYFNTFPQFLTLSASGVRFPSGLPAPNNTSANPLHTYLAGIMNEDVLPIELNYSYDYMPENESQLDSVMTISLADSFKLESKWLLKNFPMESLTDNTSSNSLNQGSTSIIFQTTEIPNASMAIEDSGIIEAMLTIQGEPLGLSSDEYRKQLLAQLQTAALFIPQQLQPLAQDFLGSFTEFMDGDKTLQISVTPEFGGNIQQLQGEVMGAFFIGNFSRISELLNLNIETVPSAPVNQ